MIKPTLTIALLALALACGCQPRPGEPSNTSRAPAAAGKRKVVPTDDASARTLAKQLMVKARLCFPQVYRVSAGRDLTEKTRRDTARQDRAIRLLGTELHACLTGSSYRGEAMVSAEAVKGWLGLSDCAAFAKAAFRSRACFALAGVLDRAGYPGAAPPRPAGPSAGAGSAPAPCANPEPATSSGHYAASHILFFHVGSRRVPARVTRSKAAAKQLAARITALALAQGADFAKLARRWSEGPTGKRGGRLGPFRYGQMVKPFSDAVKRLCIGDITGPVETVFGFHVIKRDQP